MNKHAPTIPQIGVMIAFALSCFGLLLFLWISFGGSTPIRANGYGVTVAFREGAQLATASDVRISGVTVGKVRSLRPDRPSGRLIARLELEARHAPLPLDTRATLRSKTLLGETYVELSPGDHRGPALAEGGRIPEAQVRPTVEFDEILRSFDRRARRDTRTATQLGAAALRERGDEFSAALGVVSPFADELTALLRVLDRQDQAVRGLVRDTGRTFDALSERRGDLSGLIVAGERVTRTTARRDRRFAAAIDALGPFQDEVGRTTERLNRFSRRTDPLVRLLLPVADGLGPTARDLKLLAPDLRRFFADTEPVVDAARRGLPAFTRVTNALRPFVTEVEPLLREVNPSLEYAGRYDDEIRAFFANASSATHASAPGRGNRRFHYLRQRLPITSESLGVYAERLRSNRTNPYRLPGGIADPRTMSVIDDRNCRDGSQPGVLGTLLGTTFDGSNPAPGCVLQRASEFQGRLKQVPWVTRESSAPPRLAPVDGRG